MVELDDQVNLSPASETSSSSIPGTSLLAATVEATATVKVEANAGVSKLDLPGLQILPDAVEERSTIASFSQQKLLLLATPKPKSETKCFQILTMPPAPGRPNALYSPAVSFFR